MHSKPMCLGVKPLTSLIAWIRYKNEAGQLDNVDSNHYIYQRINNVTLGAYKLCQSERTSKIFDCILDLAAGDIRSGSLNQIITVAGDGATAALSAGRLLQELS